MNAIVTLFPLFGYASLFYIYAKRSVSVSIFFAMSAIITVLFLLGMVHLLKIGTLLLFYGGIVLFAGMAVRHRREMARAAVSVPFVLFVLTSIFYLYLMKDAHLFFWDEYSHWGPFVKEMYYFGHFYDNMTVAANPIYPPGSAIWEYFTVLPTGYSEGKLYFSVFLLLFGSVLMMYENLTWKQLHWIGLVFVIQMVLFAGFGHWFSAIYVDHIIGAMFAGTVLSYLSGGFAGKGRYLFIFPFVALVLIKEIGLYFATASAGLIWMVNTLRYRLHADSGWVDLFRSRMKDAVVLVVFIVLAVGILKVWDMRQIASGIPVPPYSMSSIVHHLATGESVLSPEQQEVYETRFWHTLLHQQVHKEKLSLMYNEFSHSIATRYSKTVKLSTLGVMLFFLLMGGSLLLAIRSRQKRIEVSAITLYLLLVTVVYIAILYVSYPLSLGLKSLQMVSYVRYVNMTLLPLLLIGFALMLPMYCDNTCYKKGTKTGLGYFVLPLFWGIVLTMIVRPYLPPLYSQMESPARKQVDQAVRHIVQIIPPQSKLLVIFPVRNNGSLDNMLEYALIPAHTTILRSTPGDGSREKMLKRYAGFDYIWFAALNRTIAIDNQGVLKVDRQGRVFSVYRIRKTSSALRFEPLI